MRPFIFLLAALFAASAYTHEVSQAELDQVKNQVNALRDNLNRALFKPHCVYLTPRRANKRQVCFQPIPGYELHVDEIDQGWIAARWYPVNGNVRRLWIGLAQQFTFGYQLRDVTYADHDALRRKNAVRVSAQLDRHGSYTPDQWTSAVRVRRVNGELRLSTNCPNWYTVEPLLINAVDDSEFLGRHDSGAWPLPADNIQRAVNSLARRYLRDEHDPETDCNQR